MCPLISFIIPSYNFADYIECCVKSILSQTYSNIEVIIVNDGSTDNSKQVIERLVEKDSRIRAIHKENEGVSIARNVGLNISKGEYVVFVDADDYLAHDYAEYMLSLVKETGGEFCLSVNCFTNKKESQVEKEFVTVMTSDEAMSLLLSPRVIVGSWNKIFKRQFLIDNKLTFSSSLFYGEGLKFITSVAQLCSSVGVGNRKVYFYRRNNYSSATTKFNIDKFYNGLQSIDEIKKNLITKNPEVHKMCDYHKCQFCMGTVVRIQSAGKVKEHYAYYKQNLSYVRRNVWKFILDKKLPLYNRGILLGCAISPILMALLDDWRRSKIAVNSVL